MENRDVRTIRTALRSPAGQVSGAPSGVPAQFRTLISRPRSPPFVNGDGREGSPLTVGSPDGA
jgi:hypothetical protein